MVRMALTRPLSQLTIQSFGDISRFLREGVADEESRQMRDSMVVLAQAVDTAVRSRRARSDAVDISRHASDVGAGFAYPGRCGLGVGLCP